MLQGHPLLRISTSEPLMLPDLTPGVHGEHRRDQESAKPERVGKHDDKDVFLFLELYPTHAASSVWYDIRRIPVCEAPRRHRGFISCDFHERAFPATVRHGRMHSTLEPASYLHMPTRRPLISAANSAPILYVRSTTCFPPTTG